MNGLPVASALPVALPGHPADRLSTLFDAHYDRLYRLARRLVPHVDNALDLVQEIARAAVLRALDVLTPRRRAVVVMHELEGVSISALANLLGISTISVRWHLSRGRRDLARVLRPQMGATNDDRERDVAGR
jgi:DNA-directed RNA polymerase specialized sigma24 family protein